MRTSQVAHVKAPLLRPVHSAAPFRAASAPTPKLRLRQALRTTVAVAVALKDLVHVLEGAPAVTGAIATTGSTGLPSIHTLPTTCM